MVTWVAAVAGRPPRLRLPNGKVGFGNEDGHQSVCGKCVLVVRIGLVSMHTLRWCHCVSVAHVCLGARAGVWSATSIAVLQAWMAEVERIACTGRLPSFTLSEAA